MKAPSQGSRRARNPDRPRSAPAARARRPERNEGSAPWSIAAVLAIPAFLAIAAAVAIAWKPPLLAAGLYAVASIATFVAYAIDKSAATRRAWRTAESTLHLLALAGGWPGALLAQQLLRHKSSKASFRRVFWATVVLNISAFIALGAAGWSLRPPPSGV